MAYNSLSFKRYYKEINIKYCFNFSEISVIIPFIPMRHCEKVK